MLHHLSLSRTQGRSPARRPRGFRPALVALEDRIVPSGAGWAIDADPDPTNSGLNNWGMALDGNNNSFIVGYLNGTTVFGSTTLTSVGGTDAYIAKYDANGSFVWVKSFGGASDDWAAAAAADSNGNTYVSGKFQGQAAFGPFTLTSAGGDDAYVAKLDPSGNLLWVSQIGGASTDQSWGVAVDSTGNVYATGRFTGPASIGLNGVATGLSLTPSAGTDQDAFVLKLDASGNPLWARNMGSSGSDDQGLGVTVDPNGFVYATGRFTGTASFGNYSVTSKGVSTDAYVARLDGAGNFQWVQRMGGEGNLGNLAWGVAVDSHSADASTWPLYVSGAMNGTNCDFGSTVLKSVDADAFVARLDATTGAFTWADQLGGPGRDFSYGPMAVDGNGNVYTTGQFGSLNQSANFDPHGTFLMNPGNGTPGAYFREAFVSELDSSGNFVSAWQTVGTATDGNCGHGVAVDSAGDIWACGVINVTTTFPNGQTLSINGATWTYIMRLNAPHGGIAGTLYADLNQNGKRDGEPALIARTVYLDLNNNGIFDSGEPSAVTDFRGNYRIDNLAPGAYTVRTVEPTGWTTSGPASGAYTVTVGNGLVYGNDFGAYTPTTQTTYTNSKATNIKGRATTYSTIAVADSYSVLDVDVRLNISYSGANRLDIYLIAPDGTTVPLVLQTGNPGGNYTNTIFDDEASVSIGSGSAPFTGSYQPLWPLAVLQGKSVKGTWTLQVTNNTITTGKINSWSLVVIHTTNGNPLVAGANTLGSGSTIGGTGQVVAPAFTTLMSPGVFPPALRVAPTTDQARSRVLNDSAERDTAPYASCPLAVSGDRFIAGNSLLDAWTAPNGSVTRSRMWLADIDQLFADLSLASDQQANFF